MSAFIKADDGTLLVLGRFWDRNRSIAEQRREGIKLAGAPMTGPADARVTVVEYSDMECGFCKKRTADFDALVAKLGKELKIKRYIKSFPLTGVHPWAFRAASAGRCFFDLQGADSFFRWKAQVYAKQEELSVPGIDAFAIDYAYANEIPDAKFRACYLQAKSNDKINADLTEGLGAPRALDADLLHRRRLRLVVLRQHHGGVPPHEVPRRQGPPAADGDRQPWRARPSTEDETRRRRQFLKGT